MGASTGVRHTASLVQVKVTQEVHIVATTGETLRHTAVMWCMRYYTRERNDNLPSYYKTSKPTAEPARMHEKKKLAFLFHPCLPDFARTPPSR